VSRRVFVSYARADRRLAHELVKQLKGAGHIVWVDESGVDAGEVWAEEIVEAIRTSQLFVLLATTTSVNSKDVQKEVDVAGKYGIPIVPAVVPPVRIPAQIEYHISGRHQTTIDPEHSALGFSALAAELDEIRPARRPTPGWVPGLIFVLFVGLVGLAIWTVASGALPPWGGRPGCEQLQAEVIGTSPARFGSFDSGAALDIEIRNLGGRVAKVPSERSVTAGGTSGRQYPSAASLADGSWFFGVEVQPGLSARVQLGLSSPAGGTDVVTVTIEGVKEAALPFLKCDLTLDAIEVTFAPG
jgi:hypothetical protein